MTTTDLALTIPDPEETQAAVTRLTDDTARYLESAHALSASDSARHMLALAYDNVQALSAQATQLVAVTAGLLDAYQTARRQLKQALWERDVALDEADEAGAVAWEEARSDPQLRNEIECEIVGQLMIEADEEAWRDGYDCGYVNAHKDTNAEITYWQSKCEEYETLLKLAGVEITDTAA